MRPSRQAARVIWLVLGNLIVLALLLSVVEIGYRIRRDGFAGALANAAQAFDRPYSTLGTGDAVLIDDLLGYRLNPGSPGVNSLSMRNTELAIPKPHGVRRIVFLGDSVPGDNTGLVALAREAFADSDPYMEVVNASIPGYTTYQELLFLRHYVARAQPDLTVLVFVLNDNHRFLHEFDAQGRMLLTREAAEQLNVNSPVGALTSRSYVLTKIKLGLVNNRNADESIFPWEGRTDVRTAWHDQAWVDTERYIGDMRQLLSGQGSRLVIVVVPFEPQLSEELLAIDYGYVTKPQAKLMAICARYEIPCLDLFQAFRERIRATRLYTDGIHLTDDGHRLAANEIMGFINRSGLHHSQ